MTALELNIREREIPCKKYFHSWKIRSREVLKFFGIWADGLFERAAAAMYHEAAKIIFNEKGKENSAAVIRKHAEAGTVTLPLRCAPNRCQEQARASPVSLLRGSKSKVDAVQSSPPQRNSSNEQNSSRTHTNTTINELESAMYLWGGELDSVLFCTWICR